MASHQVAIAKASFSAGLLRPDPTSIPRDSIEHFHTLLNNTLTRCSAQNVQKCKHWILDNVVQSTARFTSLGKYLNALAGSFKTTVPDREKREPSSKRKTIHILYLINDILHHGKHHSNDASIYGKVQPLLMGIVGSASSYTGCPKHQKKVSDLLELWKEKDYYSSNYIDKLRVAAQNASSGTEAFGEVANELKNEASASKSTRDAPFVMPASHGDSSMPWFDLPAANLMPHIVPNSTKALNPDLIKPLQLVAGPADASLVTAVKGLLDDVAAIFGTESRLENDDWDVDELGQSIEVDEITGDILAGEGYYGWTRAFCERMNKKKKGLDISDQVLDRERKTRSRSSSRSMRKRRYSNSSDESFRERHRSRQRKRSYSSSRSSTPDRSRRAQRDGSRGRDSSPQNFQNNSRDHNSRFTTTVPDAAPSRTLPQGPPHPPSFGIPPPPPFVGMSHPQMAFQQNFNQHFPPPPPPQNMSHGNGFNASASGQFFSGSGNNNQNFNSQTPPFGSWPPPPPPNMGFHPSQPWPPPPPPGGPPPMQHQQTHNIHHQTPGSYTQAGAGNMQQQEQSDSRGSDGNTTWNGGQQSWRGGFRGRGRGW